MLAKVATYHALARTVQLISTDKPINAAQGLNTTAREPDRGRLQGMPRLSKRVRQSLRIDRDAIDGLIADLGSPETM